MQKLLCAEFELNTFHNFISLAQFYKLELLKVNSGLFQGT
ncbi:hypothetical protein SAMN05421777_11858 [Fluoribacter gormanii]|uniref:Uncharacterized protein n=1 Tax=Fluoribacter gormanii TaxID=464 RepID=A0A377GFD4_9GAMM|nr:hypothetical protein SAMN05421777_11858 [Fluoribacter gormanii]STO23527.1 Uncharacterised protein [Fluoribacter gormanii]